MSGITSIFPRDQAKPISFSRNAKGEVFVEGDFPPYALIAHALIGETTLEMGKIILSEILQMNPKPASMFAFSRPSCKTDARC